MKNTMHTTNEKFELVELTPEYLAKVTGGAMMAYLPSNVVENSTGWSGAICEVGGYLWFTLPITR
jgi:hypothetical protein